MRILNLDAEGLKASSELSEDGLKISLGKRVRGFENTLCIKADTVGVVGAYKLLGEHINGAIKGNTLDLRLPWAKEGYNLLFTGVLNAQHNSIAKGITLLGDLNSLENCKVLALGMLPVVTNPEDSNLRGRTTYLNAVLYINSMCDYRIDGVIYSGQNGEVKKYTSHPLEWALDKVLLSNMFK